MNNRKKYIKKMRLLVVIGGCVMILAVLTAGCFGIYKGITYLRDEHQKKQVQQTEEPYKPISSESPEPEVSATPQPTIDPTEQIYTYLQGPKSWKKRIAWSGEWGDMYMDGGYFGGFGCGICCMANIYSSITPYRCTPIDMYRYAKKHTYYGGGAAIEWGYMRRGLSSLGVTCKVKKKPSSYRTFARSVEKSQCCTVLVSSYDSRKYWQSTPGHYVTIFLYDKQKEQVFLADSGDPNHNRHWVSLRTIYRSLKTSSSWQYMTVTDYNQKKDPWKHRKLTGRMQKPAFI